MLILSLEIYPPKILSSSSPDVIDGNTAVITCEIDSHPIATVTWFKDNIPLNDIGILGSIEECKSREQGKYFTIVTNSNKSLGLRTHKLVICKSVWKLNDGIYTCFGSNQLGNTQKDNVQHVYGMYFSNKFIYLLPKDC